MPELITAVKKKTKVRSGADGKHPSHVYYKQSHVRHGPKATHHRTPIEKYMIEKSHPSCVFFGGNWLMTVQ